MRWIKAHLFLYMRISLYYIKVMLTDVEWFIWYVLTVNRRQLNADHGFIVPRLVLAECVTKKCDSHENIHSLHSPVFIQTWSNSMKKIIHTRLFVCKYVFQKNKSYKHDCSLTSSKSNTAVRKINYCHQNTAYWLILIITTQCNEVKWSKLSIILGICNFQGKDESYWSWDLNAKERWNRAKF